MEQADRVTQPGRSQESPWRARAPWVVALSFSVSGVIHLAHPITFTAIVPHFLPDARGLVDVSGVVELCCAIGLWRRDRWAGVAAAVLLLVLWPANLQEAITAQQGHDVTVQTLTWLRFPLQIPLIWCAVQSGRADPPPFSERTGASR
jgi:uncharacterized membrane protein